MKPTPTPLRTAAEQYKKSLEIKGRTKSTIKNNLVPINHLVAVIGNVRVEHVSHDDLEKLFVTGEWAPTTRNIYLTSLKMFFRWCARRGYLNPLEDPTLEWESWKVPKTKKTWVEAEDFPRLLDAAGAFHPRDRAVVALGLFTFCRASEIRALRVGDVDLKENMIEIYRLKTQQYDQLPISLELRNELVEWFKAYRRQLGVDVLNTKWFLIPRFGPYPMTHNHRTGRLGKVEGALLPLIPTEPMYQVYRPVKRALAAIGCEGERLGAHSLRRSGSRAAFAQLREGGYDRSIGLVSAMLGHASVKTTEVYIGENLDRLERNETWSGKPMFPNVFRKPGLEVIHDGDGGENDLRSVQ